MKELFFDFKSYKELILTHKISQVWGKNEAMFCPSKYWNCEIKINLHTHDIVAPGSEVIWLVTKHATLYSKMESQKI